MGFLLKYAAFVVSMELVRVRAGLAPAPEPVITPGPMIARDSSQTLAWYSSELTGGETIYAPWVFDAATITYISSGNYFRRCLVSTSCVMFTGCSSGYMVAATTSSYCGISGATGGVSTNYCSNHIMLPSLGAVTGGQSWYWCDKAPLTGYTFYAKEPPQPTLILTSSSQITIEPSLTSSEASTLPTISSPTAAATSPAVNSGTTTPIGAIVGGVVGGAAVLGALAFAVLYTMRRDKRNKRATASYQPAHGGSQPLYRQGYSPQTGHYTSTAYQANEQKPQGVVPGSHIPQAYPLGPYDPHLSQQYPSSPPLQELSAPLQSPPQELPAQQKTLR